MAGRSSERSVVRPAQQRLPARGIVADDGYLGGGERGRVDRRLDARAHDVRLPRADQAVSPRVRTSPAATGARGWPRTHGFVGPTPESTTGPSVGSSSVVWLTPVGVIVSIASGIVLGSAVQIAAVFPSGQTPNVSAPAG